ncbi:MAG: GerMN domain-containing protein [Peptococcaceae bacterium]|nr:GerMN domain-containing protein [Peptococcaceae bacterium]
MKRVFVVLLAGLMLTGCSAVTKFEVQPVVQPAPTQTVPTPTPTPAPQKPSTTVPSKPQIKQLKVALYFPSYEQQGDFLVKVYRDVTVVNGGIVKSIIAALQQGDPRYGKVIPEQAKLLRAWVKDDIVYLDFSHEFRERHWGGTSGENATIFGIVNSLTELPQIHRVQFLLEGKVEESILGHLDTHIPLERNPALIKS